MHQMTGIYNKPSSRVLGGQYNLFLETSKDLTLHELIVYQRPQKRARIEVLSFDGMKMLFKVEFANVYVTSIRHYYNHQDNHPARFKCTLTPGITRYFGDNNIIHELGWNPDNPFTDNTPVVVRETAEEKKELTHYFLTDKEGNSINTFSAGDIIVLNIETQNRVGDSINIDLNNDRYDFKHNGKILENDVLEDIKLTGDLKKIELEVVNRVS